MERAKIVGDSKKRGKFCCGISGIKEKCGGFKQK
jgi:hypothetical protein